MSTFCQHSYHRKCQRKGQVVKQSQNIVNVVCEQPPKYSNGSMPIIMVCLLLPLNYLPQQNAIYGSPRVSIIVCCFPVCSRGCVIEKDYFEKSQPLSTTQCYGVKFLLKKHFNTLLFSGQSRLNRRTRFYIILGAFKVSFK